MTENKQGGFTFRVRLESRKRIVEGDGPYEKRGLESGVCLETGLQWRSLSGRNG